MTLSNAQATTVMHAAGLTPLEMYRGSAAPWTCICDTCGRLTSTTYAKVRQGGHGCRPCGSKRSGAKRRGVKRRGATRIDLKLPAKVATAVLRAAGCEPLVKYQGSKTPWLSTHTCGRRVRPRLDSIRLGQGACWICASRKYIPELSGCFYLIKSVDHPSYPSPVLKVGVTNNRTWTRKPAWTLLTEFHFDDGNMPLVVERGIMTCFNSELGLEPCPSATNLTTKGFAEAFLVADLAQAGVSVPDVIDKVTAFIELGRVTAVSS